MDQMRNPIEKCPRCGGKVWFSDPLWNQCETCHDWFSGTGQQVISPRDYEDDDENTESIAEIYSDRDPEDVGFDSDGSAW